MDERCKACACKCKRLDASDQPVGYCFEQLSPTQVTRLIQMVLFNQRLWHHLELVQSAESTGNQLVVLIRARSPAAGDDDSDIVLIVQGQMHDSGPTEIWLRYGLPEEYCEQPEVVAEFTSIVDEVLQVLGDNDCILASHRKKVKLDCD
jgi:hypothetical protein